jgi:hypothetical protein
MKDNENYKAYERKKLKRTLKDGKASHVHGMRE